MKRLIVVVAALAAALSGCALTQEGWQPYAGATAPGTGEVWTERPFPRAADRGLF